MFDFARWFVERVHQFVWESLVDSDRSEWQGILRTSNNLLILVTKMLWTSFDSMGCVKGIVATRNSLVITLDGQYYYMTPLRIPWRDVSLLQLYFHYLLQLNVFNSRTHLSLSLTHDHVYKKSIPYQCVSLSIANEWRRLGKVSNWHDWQFSYKACDMCNTTYEPTVTSPPPSICFNTKC